MTAQSDSNNNWRMIGHEWAVSCLRRALSNGRQRHAYLIAGGPALGKMRLALAFAMALNCQADDQQERPCFTCPACRAIQNRSHPDLILAGEAAPLKIDEARNVLRVLALKPYSGRYRIAIFADFQLVMPLAQDALLKTLEEPAPHALVILLATSVERVLPTIRSRAQLIPLRPLPQAKVRQALLARGCHEDRAELLSRLGGGRIGWAISALEDETALLFRGEMLDALRDILAGSRLPRLKAADQLSRQAGKDRALLRNMLEIWQSYWRDVLLESHGSPVTPCNIDRGEEIRALAERVTAESALSALEATGGCLRALDTNANPRLALDALFLTYPGLDAS